MVDSVTRLQNVKGEDDGIFGDITSSISSMAKQMSSYMKDIDPAKFEKNMEALGSSFSKIMSSFQGGNIDESGLEKIKATAFHMNELFEQLSKGGVKNAGVFGKAIQNVTSAMNSFDAEKTQSMTTAYSAIRDIFASIGDGKNLADPSKWISGFTNTLAQQAETINKSITDMAGATGKGGAPKSPQKDDNSDTKEFNELLKEQISLRRKIVEFERRIDRTPEGEINNSLREENELRKQMLISQEELVEGGSHADVEVEALQRLHEAELKYISDLEQIDAARARRADKSSLEDIREELEQVIESAEKFKEEFPNVSQDDVRSKFIELRDTVARLKEELGQFGRDTPGFKTLRNQIEATEKKMQKLGAAFIIPKSALDNIRYSEQELARIGNTFNSVIRRIGMNVLRKSFREATQFAKEFGDT